MTNEYERLNLKVPRAHKMALRNLARAEGETMSVILRGLIRDAAMARGLWPGAGSSRGRQGDRTKENTRG